MPLRPVLFLVVILLLPSLLIAQDRIFTRTYQSGVLPYGVMEIEYWNTVLAGRDKFHRQLNQRLELELGLGKKVQTALYLNVSSESAAVNDSTITSASKIGFSNEWKVQLTNPYVNAWGTTLYGELGVSADEVELETKIILDKVWGKNVFAFNLVSELEFETEYESAEHKIETEVETPFELTFAYMNFIGKHTGLGIEATNYNSVSEAGGWENSVWYAGPTFHVHGERWWINLNIQPQLFNAHTSSISPEHSETVHYDKIDTRLILSFTL